MYLLTQSLKREPRNEGQARTGVQGPAEVLDHSLSLRQ